MNGSRNDYDDDTSEEANHSRDGKEQYFCRTHQQEEMCNSIVVDFSVTQKWSDRIEAWERFSREVVDAVDSGDDQYNNNNNMVVDAWEKCKKELYLDFEAPQEGVVVDVLGCYAAIEDLYREIGSYAKEIRTLEQETQAIGEGEAKNQNSIINEERIKDKRELIKVKKELIKCNKELIKEAKLPYVHAQLFQILTKHQDVASNLDIYGLKGNETTRSVQQPSAMADSKRVTKNLVSPTKIAKANGPPNDSNSLAEELSGEIADNEKAKLKLFQDFVVEILKKGTMELCTDGVNSTVRAIMEWDENNQDKPDFAHFVKPNPATDRETDIDQPLVYAILVRILKILQQDVCTSKEAFTPPFLNHDKELVRGARRIDFLVHNFREYLSCLLPTMIQGAVEVKATGGTSPRLEKAVNQCTGHLGKRLQAAFHFFGIGSETVADYGIATTVDTFCIVKMALQNVGKLDVEVCCEKTKPIELSTNKDAFCILAGALKLSSKGLENRTLAVMETGTISTDEKVTRTCSSLSVNGYLGSGAFGDVYRASDPQAREVCFVKFPRASDTWISLREECQILQALHCGEDMTVSVPRVVRFSTFNLKRGGQIGRSVGLVLEGLVGEPLSSSLLHEMEKEKAEGIVTKIADVVQFAHEKNIFHMDIRPGNIIIHHRWDKVDVMLSDWGCALTAKTMSKFRGSLCYAHDQVITCENVPMQKRERFDWAPLAYTFFHMCRNDLPWRDKMTNRSDAKKGIADRRVMFGDWWKEYEQTSGITSELQEKLVEAALLPRRRSVRNAGNKAQDETDTPKGNPDLATLVSPRKNRRRESASGPRRKKAKSQGNTN